MNPDFARQAARALEALRTQAAGDEWRIEVNAFVAGMIAEHDARKRALGVARRWWLWAVAGFCAAPGVVLGWRAVFRLMWGAA